MDYFKAAKPRTIESRKVARPVIIFSDGACEPEGTSIGAVIITQEGECEKWGCYVSQETVDSWRTKCNQKQVIHQAGLFPLLVSRLTWAEHIRHKRVLYFVDNEGARSSMVKAYSPVLVSLQIVMSCLEWDGHNDSLGWYARVPSYSNCGDAPSRLKHNTLDKGFKVVTPVFPPGHTPGKLLE